MVFSSLSVGIITEIIAKNLKMKKAKFLEKKAANASPISNERHLDMFKLIFI